MSPTPLQPQHDPFEQVAARAGAAARSTTERLPVTTSALHHHRQQRTIRRGLAAGAALLAASAVLALVVLDRPEDSAQVTPAAPTQASSSTASPIDTTAWTTFASDRYGFSIGHPSDWTVQPADHDWTLTEDAEEFPSTGWESFHSPRGDVGVSAWSVAAEPGTTIEQTSEGVEAWVEEYCQQTDARPCTGIADRAVPLCNERRDCHSGLLVPFEDDVQAFFTGGNYQDEMVVVAVWRPETHGTVQPYGGSQQLLEAFLSTMDVSVSG